MAKLTNALLKRACKAAEKHSEMSALITEAFEERYGKTHSDVDCDELIDALDYHGGPPPTVAECDEAMARCGAPRIGTSSHLSHHQK